MINLEKGGRINLGKEAPALKTIRIGLGWDANKFDDGKKFDLDASVFGLKNDVLYSEGYFVFYNNLKSPDGAIIHHGDERTGDTVGDDEKITIELLSLNKDIDELSVIVTIFEPNFNFGQVKNSYIKLYNAETNEEIAKYELEDDFSMETAVQFGSLMKKNNEWIFKAVGAGYKRGLDEFVKVYGGNV